MGKNLALLAHSCHEGDVTKLAVIKVSICMVVGVEAYFWTCSPTFMCGYRCWASGS